MNVCEFPRISVGMSVFNCERTLDAAIRSILNQTYSDWELLLFDDGSTDGTVEVARRFGDRRIRIIADGQNKHMATRMNEAIAMSRGEYFARMDGDDIAYPERLQLQVSYMEAHPEVDLLGTAALVFRDDGSVVGGYPFRETHEELCRRPWAGIDLGHPTWLGRTRWFRMHGYRPLPRAQDQDLLLRTYHQSCFACLPEILFGWRQDKLSLKKRLRNRYHFTRSIYREFCARRAHLTALRGVAEQTAKGMIDILAIGTGWGIGRLRRRLQPLDDAALERWDRVWEQVHDARGASGRAASPRMAAAV